MHIRKKHLSLPYNPALQARAKELRKAGNLSEVLLWEQLKKGKLLGKDFDRQRIIGNYIVDFFCSECGVVIEIDGSSHDHKEEYDQEREDFLCDLGLQVIHISVEDIFNKLNAVVTMLENHPALQLPPLGMTKPS